MSEQNQYQAPNSNVEQSGASEYGQVKAFSVSGRIGRIRYFAYSIVLLIVLVLIMTIAAAVASFGAVSAVDHNAGPGSMVIVGIFIGYGVLFIGSLMLTIQRSHDFNASGWMCLLLFVPFVSLIFLFIPGTDGENRYGLKTPPNGAATFVVLAFVVLIPIIGILAAIAIPAYQGYIDTARQVQLQQNN